MKANNFPDRIYLPRDVEYPQFPDIWWEREASENNVEYIRTDAFIKKATKWLIDNIQNYTDDGMGERSFVLVQDLKEDFKKYME